MAIEIQAEPRSKIPVTLVGQTYQVKPPKMAVLAVVAKAAAKGTDDAAAMVEHVENLVKLMFGKNGAPAVMARLSDEEDDLDYEHIMKCAEAVMEEQTGDPTSSSPASSTE
jgi:hypothetical protein